MNSNRNHAERKIPTMIKQGHRLPQAHAFEPMHSHLAKRQTKKAEESRPVFLILESLESWNTGPSTSRIDLLSDGKLTE